MFKAFTIVIFLGFMIPILVNMIDIIKINYRLATSNTKEKEQSIISLKRKARKILVLFFLLVVVMFLLFFLSRFFNSIS